MNSLLCLLFLSVSCYGAEVCWEPCGCFTDDAPFDDRPLPEDHEVMELSWLLYTQSNPNNPTAIVINNRDSIDVPSEYNPSNPTKVLIHGWNSGPSAMDQIRNAYIDGGFDYNVLVADWSVGAGRVNYALSASNTQVVGACTAWVAEELNNDRSNFHCSGHSLGGQTCGYMGKNLNDLGRISGLDPAGPLFDEKDARVHLDSSDCDFMDNIHTNAEGDVADLGMRKAVGDVDFYPNNGGRQDGCNNANCDHGICRDYFAESINNPTAYPAYPCSDGDNVANCDSCTNDCQFMGEPSIDNPGRGTYYRDMSD